MDFPRAGGSDHGHGRAGLHPERDAPEDLLSGSVSEGDISESDLPPDPGECTRGTPVADLGRRVEELEGPLPRHETGLDDRGEFSQVLDRGVELHREGEEPDEVLR